MNTKIYSVTHKKYWMPSDELYIPIQVGFGENLGILRDDTGYNISNKNKSYCELTAIYWIWKNVDNVDYVGIDHYRRHFSLKRSINKKDSVINHNQLTSLIGDVVILPKKRHYYIETNYSQYIHAHNEIDLKMTRDIIENYYPNYLKIYDDEMKKTSGHRFNMFIMPWNIFDKYCEWLFDILFKLEDILDISDYTENDKRVFGFVAERLLDVYLVKNNIQTKELKYVFMDNENWPKKLYNFMKRKIRYE